MATAVNDRSAAVETMAADWPMLDALIGGTTVMRSLGEGMLPKWPNEDKDAYDTRLATATLFPAYRRTVSVMAGKPFSKPVTLSDDTPPEIQAWADDIDREGVNLHTFAAEMFRESFFGLAGILVDTSKREPPGARPMTVAEEKSAGIRPYFVRVMHNQLLGWRVEMVNGARRLGQLRIKECITRDDGEFGQAEVERVRVLEPGRWRVFEKSATEFLDSKPKWILVEEGVTSLPIVPFVPVYGERTAFMAGRCPLLDLAHLNVKHWQSQSDQDNILHVARVPILFAKGLGDNPITVGAGVAVKAEGSEFADLKYVEHTGKAIEAGAQSLAALEDQMIQAGAELLVKKPGSRTATETSNDAEANKCDLQRMAEGFEDALDQALQLMAAFASLPSGGNVTLFKDYGADLLSEASGQLVLLMQQAGLISKPTAINEMKRRGELSAEIDADAEAEAVAEEGPPLGTIMAPDPAALGSDTQPGASA